MLRFAPILMLGLPACAAVQSIPTEGCEADISQFRDSSAYIWDARDVSPSNVIDRGWARRANVDLSDPREKRQTMALLYAELNNLVKPDVAPNVRPDVVAALGTAIRCVKDDIRRTPRDTSKDSTLGLDLRFARETSEAFGVPIDLGEPL